MGTDFRKDYEITWETIFPRNLLKKGQRDILQLFPPEYRILEGGEDLAKANKTALSRFWNANEHSRMKYENVRSNIIRHASGEDCSFEDARPVQDLKTNLESMLAELSAADRERYEEQINAVIDCLKGSGADGAASEETALYRCFRSWDMKEIFEHDLQDFSSRLACLAMIAATWYFWRAAAEGSDGRKGKAMTKGLPGIVFPFRPKKSGGVSDQNEEIRKIREREKKEAREKLAEAEERYSAGEYAECRELCLEITDQRLADDAVLGKAFYLLVKCCELGCKFKGYDRGKFIRRAISYGCHEAREEWKTFRLDTLLYKPSRPEADDAVVVLNCENKRTALFLKTIPEHMEKHFGDYVILASAAEELAGQAVPAKKIRYLLFDDDLGKNFQDMLSILDKIKSWGADPHKRRSSTDLWDISIYIRMEEESSSALLDTALGHMDRYRIPVHVIDDDKWPVHRLLSRYPLFYPIRSHTKYALANKRFALNYVVIAQDNDGLTRWLIREAFWLGCFWYHGVTFSITVLSPAAEQIKDRLKFDCPGMSDILEGMPSDADSRLPDADRISGIALSFKNIRSGSLYSSKLTDELDGLGETNSLFYFVINAKDDLSSLNLGIKVREWSIRNLVKSGSRINKTELPLIACHCEDSNIARLSESMVVQMEKFGDSWYNNYLLIPFGALRERYTWEELDGGYYGRVAQSVHLQHCGVDESDFTEKREEALKSYYAKCYNRDSSMAAALSLPYRLFQTYTDDSDHIIPKGWNIPDENAYTNHSESGSADAMASAFEKSFHIGENEKNLMLYEHARWVRWMIARGWCTANTQETIAYMEAGSPGHQLYIGRLHSCICAFDELDRRYDALHGEALYRTGSSAFSRFAESNKEFFTGIDRSSVKKTPKLLRAAWFAARKKN
ncbi:MAG: hypothetical protein HFI64_11880 [Lachnospiraceae bacterium]|nr:hypothetical protein [Lachnospiraceae bacterium]